MTRLSSLAYNPSETRRLLRDRLPRFLGTPNNTVSPTIAKALIKDELLLDLMLGMNIEFARDAERARTIYEAALPENSNEPSLSKLIDDGLVRVVWGRLSTPFDVATAIRSTGQMTALAALLAKQYEAAYSFTSEVRNNLELKPFAEMVDKGVEPTDLRCKARDWVAARLWDRSSRQGIEKATALRTWVDRWNILGCPSLTPSHAWDQGQADDFREAALSLLETELGLDGWQEMRTRIVKEMAMARNCVPADIEELVPPVPNTLIDRALWFAVPAVEKALMGTFQMFDGIYGVIRLLLNDVEAEENAPAPHKLIGRMLAVAVERPEVLFSILMRIRRAPILLADLLLHPPTSGVACFQIADWSSNSGAWDREITTSDNQTTKAIAFADAVSVMGQFLKAGTLSAEEAAALLDWMHRRAKQKGFATGERADTLLEILRSELVKQTPSVQLGMVKGLTALMPGEGLGTSTFSAALDLIESGQLTQAIEPAPVVTAYIDAVAAGGYALSASTVSTDAAVVLFHLAKRCTGELYEQFLAPIESKNRIKAALASDDNIYTVTDDLARSLRAHIRILSRAIAGLAENTPDGLVVALIAAVRDGALKHDEKGRIAAFAARYETWPVAVLRDRPIAVDLGAALRALPEELRNRLLSAIAEIDEPMVLAQMLPLVPYTARASIERRVADLTPAESGSISLLTEAQARIDALLAAGFPEAAALFIEDESQQIPHRAVPGRELVRLRVSLQLKILREEWNEVGATEPPPGLSHADTESARATIEFYNAVAELMKPDGNRTAAERIFADLHRRRPDNPAYATNLFAARLSLLLGGDLFVRLHGADLVRGRQLLAETEEMILRLRSLGDPEAEIFNCNKALLLLALGDPEGALELLMPMQEGRLPDTVAAYSGVALSRTGRVAEALAVLKRAEQQEGRTPRLAAAQAHVQSGAAYRATVSVLSKDDPAPRIKQALFDLLQMDPVEQATVLMPSPEPFDDFVVDVVRAAAASVTELVPMMKGIDFTSCEDDVTALLRQLLIPHLHRLGWSVPDQSKGGFAPGNKGNPGERDLLVQKASSTLTVIEAVVCDSGLPRQKLSTHFQKLFGYSSCRLFFHLTYAYGDNTRDLIDLLKDIAQKDTPKSHTFKKCEEIPHTDSRPVGFGARYDGEFGEVKVVFIVLDMKQAVQREAAKAAKH